MARIVELADTGPLVLKKEKIDSLGVVAVCRCGLSAGWPFCDGSHAKTRSETPGRLVAYTRESGELTAKPVGLPIGEADPRRTSSSAAQGSGDSLKSDPSA